MSKMQVVFGGVAAVLVLAGTAGGYALYSHQREAARIEAIRQVEMDGAKQRVAEIAKLRDELEEQNKLVDAARSELEGAQTEADRTRAKAKLDAAVDRQQKTRATFIKMTAVHDLPTRPTERCKCVPGDPLCSCL
jgi:hypothetical protein